MILFWNFWQIRLLFYFRRYFVHFSGKSLILSEMVLFIVFISVPVRHIAETKLWIIHCFNCKHAFPLESKTNLTSVSIILHIILFDIIQINFIWLLFFFFCVHILLMRITSQKIIFGIFSPVSFCFLCENWRKQNHFFLILDF